jgi:hypothetical protein
MEAMLVMRRRPILERLRDADVFAVAARVRGLLAFAGERPEPPPDARK